MGRLISGEYSPPRELVAIGAARVTGRGSIRIDAAGLTVEGTIYNAGPPISPWASLLVLLAAVAISLSVPHAERLLTPVTLLVVVGILWLRYRAEFGRSGTFIVPWSDVEHVVRLASAQDVLAIVLARPLSGRGSPEQLFFCPADGIDDLVRSLRDLGPSTLTIDTESALRPAPSSASDEGTDLWP